MLDSDIGFYSRNYLISYFKGEYQTSISHNAAAINYSHFNTDIDEQVKVSTNFIYIGSREEKNLHIEITNIDLTKGRSLQKFADLFNDVFTHTSCVKSDILLLYFRSNREQKNPYGSLIKLNSTCYNKNNQDVEGVDPKCIYNTLKGKIDEYCRHNHILQSDVKLTLINLCAFNRLKFDISDLDKYIQFKNKVLSRCTEEELNEQVEKFIDPHNYPHYFKTEVSTYSGAAIVKEMGGIGYIKAANQALSSLNPSSSLQSLQVLAPGAIGESAGR